MSPHLSVRTLSSDPDDPKTAFVGIVGTRPAPDDVISGGARAAGGGFSGWQKAAFRDDRNPARRWKTGGFACGGEKGASR